MNATTPSPLPDGSSMRRGGRYLVQKRAGGLLDVWCCEVTPGGYVRLKRRDRVHEWFPAPAVTVLEVLTAPPPIPEPVPIDPELDEPAEPIGDARAAAAGPPREPGRGKSRGDG